MIEYHYIVELDIWRWVVKDRAGKRLDRGTEPEMEIAIEKARAVEARLRKQADTVRLPAAG